MRRSQPSFEESEGADARRVFAGVVLYTASLPVLELLTLPVGDLGLRGSLSTLSALAIAAVYFSYIDRDALRMVFSRGGRMSVRTFIGLAALMVTAQLISSYALAALEVLLNLVGMSAMYAPALTIDFSLSPSLILYSALVGPIAEELVCRGLIMRALRGGGAGFAIVTEALLFSLMHGDVSQLIFTFLAGLLLGYVAYRYSIGWAMALHIFNNAGLGLVLSRLPGAVWGPVMLAGVVIGVCTLVRHGREAFQVIAAPEAYGSYRCVWFWIFVVFELFSVALTLVRV